MVDPRLDRIFRRMSEKAGRTLSEQFEFMLRRG